MGDEVAQGVLAVELGGGGGGAGEFGGLGGWRVGEAVGDAEDAREAGHAVAAELAVEEVRGDDGGGGGGVAEFEEGGGD